MRQVYLDRQEARLRAMYTCHFAGVEVFLEEGVEGVQRLQGGVEVSDESVHPAQAHQAEVAQHSEDVGGSRIVALRLEELLGAPCKAHPQSA